MQGSDERRDVSIEILHQVAAFLRSLNEQEIEELVHGRAKLTLAGRGRKRTSPKELPADMIPEVLDRLRSLSTRDAGATYLRDVAPSRAHLAQLALAMDVPVPKTDTVSKLRERIVEAAIGYRLRSEAIRGTKRTHGEH